MSSGEMAVESSPPILRPRYISQSIKAGLEDKRVRQAKHEYL